VFLDLTGRSLLAIYKYFGGIIYLYLQCTFEDHSLLECDAVQSGIQYAANSYENYTSIFRAQYLLNS
jgi:hypothetical protein